MATRNELKKAIKQTRDWYRGMASDEDIAKHIGISIEELRDIESPPKEAKPKKAPKAAPRPPVVPPKRNPMWFAHLTTKFAHIGGTVALSGYEILFFLSLAPDNWILKALAIISALVFTLGEVGQWELGVWYKKKRPLLIAGGMALFTFIGGAALSLRDIAMYEKAVNSVDTSKLEAEYQWYTEEIESLSKQRSALDPTWVTASLKLETQIKEMVEKKTDIRGEIEAAKRTAGEAGMDIEVFIIAANTFKWPVGITALAFLLFRTFMLIVITLSTSPMKEIYDAEADPAKKLPSPQGDKPNPPSGGKLHSWLLGQWEKLRHKEPNVGLHK